MKIKGIYANRIITSTGRPTIEVTVKTDKSFGKASVPTGTSVGKHEVKAFPKSVKASVREVNTRLNKLFTQIIDSSLNSLKDVERLEKKMGLMEKSLGGNTILAISYAMIRVLANHKRVGVWKLLNPKPKKIPSQLANIIGGGAHSGGKSPDIQEYLVNPYDYKSFQQAVDALVLVHDLAKEELSRKVKGFSRGEGLEGAWTANTDNTTPFEILETVCKKATGRTGVKFRLGIDFAASELWNGKHYAYRHPITRKRVGKEEQIDVVRSLVKDYKLFYVEDPLHEEDFEGFAELNKKLRKKCLVCGDDLLVTSTKRLEIAIKKKSCNSAIVKPNQVGYFFKTLEFIEKLKKNKMTPIISHRSQESVDPMIADLAVAYQIPHIKVGISGGERVEKLNELMRIEQEIKSKNI
ncbi:MAG: phosphopyruvate hydratase [Nanoarchaeota archaeon]|nr:phosphopyruvate hydratase [Nanoarchaeota archaeon]